MKFVIENLWLIGVAIVSGGALLWPVLQQRGARLSLLQATQLINQNKAVMVDVRDAAAYAAGHVREAKNIPLAELSKRIAELDKFKSKAVIVICDNGTQSSKAAALLKPAGFAEVYGLQGGFAAWQAQGLPVTKSSLEKS